MNSDSNNIFENTFIVCDVETTGLSPDVNRITEIALIKVQNGEIKEKYSTLINPKQHIPREITYLTGISNEDVMNKPEFHEIANDVLSFLKTDSEKDKVIFTGHNVSFDYKFLNRSFFRAGMDFNFRTLCTCKLARRLLKRLKSKSLVNIAGHYEIKFSRMHRAYDDALVTSKILLNFLNVLTEEYEYESVEEVLKFQNSKIMKEQKQPPLVKKIKMEIKNLPKDPGVYFMKSRNGEILYIGKAKDLKERVSSYFRYNAELPVKIKKLIKNIHSVEFEVTNSELSALILESKLIKKHKPRFNSAIKRFRFHPFIKIDVQNDFPKVEKVYEIENDGANYYGPFRSGLTVNNLIKEINNDFKLRKCEQKTIKPSAGSSTCFYFDIGKCNAPCNLNQSKENYQDEVVKVHAFITSAEKHSVQKLYEIRMKEFSENMDYERAAFLRDRIEDIRKVMSYQKVITSAINDKKLIIKCKNDENHELFLIQNGKLVKTYNIKKSDDYDQTDLLNELTETTEYLFFSLSKYVKHKFNRYELDEIKVISNWLALNRDRNSVMEINDNHSINDIMKFISS